MLTYVQLMKRLKGMSRAEVVDLARAAGVSEHTLIKVWNLDTTNPGVLLVEKLSDHFEKAAA
jgi:DNA-binding XRE family transcriptional regulator